ncbi:MAG TPA: DciA family protein [Gammaproteobacteria bacterium]|nr:DciA family protein [Gammaproteobacteria bacterium]
MTTTLPPQANAFLQTSHQELGQLFIKIKKIQALNKRFQLYLDNTLAPHCEIAHIVDTTLILIAANAAVATQIRYQSAELINKCKKDPLFRHITHIACKVSPFSKHITLRKNGSPATKMSPLSAETSRIVQSIAASIQDPKIREVLLRIAGNT